jgi:hypothetical protein
MAVHVRSQWWVEDLPELIGSNRVGEQNLAAIAAMNRRDMYLPPSRAQPNSESWSPEDCTDAADAEGVTPGALLVGADAGCQALAASETTAATAAFVSQAGSVARPASGLPPRPAQPRAL